ncbi:hypothetical protein V1525DRAFT_402219 [Lipomyces kononenkoae]|uniref:Uncharacterized protein n=1 Tax=Lipomyces kononenkoae TaxID=34357 RepID=A0ACC3T3A4_LIPKO
MTRIRGIVTQDIRMLDTNLNVDDGIGDDRSRQMNLDYHSDIDSATIAHDNNVNSTSHSAQAHAPSFTALSLLPSLSSPLSPPNSGLPIASSTPKKLYSSRFNTSPRFGLGLNSFRQPVTGFQFSSTEFFGSLNSSPLNSPSRSPELGAIPRQDTGLGEKSLSRVDETNGEHSDESINVRDAQRDAERMARLISDPLPALASPNSAAAALPSFLQPRMHRNRSKGESLTSPSQSPTPTDRSGIPSTDISPVLANFGASSPDRDLRLAKSSNLDAPFLPIHRHFTRPGDSGDDLPRYDKESATKEAALPVKNITQDMPNYLGGVSKLDTLWNKSSNGRSITPEHLSDSKSQPLTSPMFEDDRLRTQSRSQSNRFIGSRPVQQQSEQTRSPSPRKLLRDLSRCMSSPPILSSADDMSQEGLLRQSAARRRQTEDSDSPSPNRLNGPQARRVRGPSSYVGAGGGKESTASNVLKLLENLNASMRMTRQEIEYLHNKVRSEFPESVRAEELSRSVSETARMFREDLERLERMWAVDWRIHSYVQFIVRAFILLLLAVLLFFGAASVIYLYRRALVTRPYIGPEIALGRRC